MRPLPARIRADPRIGRACGRVRVPAMAPAGPSTVTASSSNGAPESLTAEHLPSATIAGRHHHAAAGRRGPCPVGSHPGRQDGRVHAETPEPETVGYLFRTTAWEPLDPGHPVAHS